MYGEERELRQHYISTTIGAPLLHMQGCWGLEYTQGQGTNAFNLKG